MLKRGVAAYLLLIKEVLEQLPEVAHRLVGFRPLLVVGDGLLYRADATIESTRSSVPRLSQCRGHCAGVTRF